MERDEALKKMKVWSFTILTAYRNIERVVNSIDKCISAAAAGSINCGGKTMELMEAVLELIKRKERLINLKVLIDEVLDKLEAKEKKILLLRFVDRVKFEDLSKELGCCRRTAFRCYDHAMWSVGRLCEKCGYGPEWLTKRYANDNFVSKILDRVIEKSFETNHQAAVVEKVSKQDKVAKVENVAKQNNVAKVENVAKQDRQPKVESQLDKTCNEMQENTPLQLRIKLNLFATNVSC